MTDTTPTRTALVTGATSGIGRGIAHSLASLGHHVLVSGRDEQRGNAVVGNLRDAGHSADFLPADLHDTASAVDLAQRATAVTGTVDVLINNAGVYPFVNTADTDEQTFDRVYDLNVKVPFFLVATLAPAMAARGHGSIVNLSTSAAIKGVVGATAYTSSKAAIVQLTRIWAVEYGPSGVRTNTISPGLIETEGVQQQWGDLRQPFIDITPMGRVGEPREVADAVAFLTSDAASYVNGTFLTVDGGGAAA